MDISTNSGVYDDYAAIYKELDKQLANDPDVDLAEVDIDVDLDDTDNNIDTDVDFDIDFTSDFDNEIEDDSEIYDDEDTDDYNIYEDIEALAFVFTLASNDIHTIHINARGENFKELHESCDELYKLLADYADECMEISCEDGHFIHSINNAKDILTAWADRPLGEKGFDIQEGTQLVIDILHDVTISIKELYNYVSSDIQSKFDEWSRELNSKMKYFLGRVVENKETTNESMMLRNTRHNRRKSCYEHLDNLELGKSYVNFCQVEDHIEDYDVDTIDLKKGDYVIRDFQFGHLPNGGNKGYIPYKVNNVVYDDTCENQGYYDRRTRLELDDGDEVFYIVCQNNDFNGLFHRLKKNAFKK